MIAEREAVDREHVRACSFRPTTKRSPFGLPLRVSEIESCPNVRLIDLLILFGIQAVILHVLYLRRSFDEAHRGSFRVNSVQPETNSKPTWLDGISGEPVPLLILSNAELIRVVAGPGSGKTTGLKRRVQRLVLGDGVPPEKIFVGTFTRAVTKELTQELGMAIAAEPESKDQTASLEISTLHAQALRLIREYPISRADRSLRFLLSFEADAMLYDIGETVTDLDTQAKRKKQLKRVCAAWNKGTDLEQAGFSGAMNRWLRFHDGMLIDEVVMLARIGLDAGDVPTGQFDHVIIDEYQDLTAAEQRLVKKIWSGSGSLVVLGDNDQSIYRFRDNHPGGILEFDQQWEGRKVTDIPIPDNRRSGDSIVELANAMMAQAGSQKAPMIPRRGEPGELASIYWPSLSHEINGLAKYILHRKADRFLVLVPRRFIGYRLKAAVGSEAITSFEEEVLEIPLTQERFALLSFIANRTDRVSLRSLLGFHANGLDRADKRNTKAYQSIIPSGLWGKELLQAIVDGELKVKGDGSSHLRTRAFKTMEFLKTAPSDPVELINIVFNPELSTALKEREVRDKACVDLEHLRDAALKLLEQTKGENLQEVLDQLRYQVATRAQLNEPKEARVKIMTFHGAKGLEADIVIVAGLADQIVPGGIDNKNPNEAKEIREEQRRLLYVSVTRARRELIVSWPKTINYKDAGPNHVRIDPKAVTTVNDQKSVKLGRTTLLPDGPEQPQPGKSWLQKKLSTE